MLAWLVGPSGFAEISERPDDSVKVLAVVRDGESWYFDRFIEQALEQLRGLSQGQYRFEVQMLDGQNDNARIRRLLTEALGDEEVDIVYAPGVIATEMAAALPDEERTKPVMAGWSPSYETLLTAQFINEEAVYETGETLDVEEAMRMAARQNAEVQISREDERIAEEDVRVTKTNLWPQVDVEAGHGVTHVDDPIIPFFSPERAHEGSYGFAIRQVLFSDELFSTIKV